MLSSENIGSGSFCCVVLVWVLGLLVWLRFFLEVFEDCAVCWFGIH